MRPNLIFGAITVLLYISSTSLADECVPTTSQPEVAAAGWYIDNDVCQFDGCLFSIWLYQESNDIDGLQRGDEVHDDTCGGQIESDSMICGLLPLGILGRRREDARRASGAALGTVAILGGAVAFMPTADAC